MSDFEVLIVGSGPAGCAAALNLAGHHRVAMVDFQKAVAPRIGESLPPVARRLFAGMGLLESFLKQGHAPCFGNRSRWGADDGVEDDFLRDPDGHGWHLVRVRFDSWLRDAAETRGAHFVPGRLTALEWKNNQWQAQIAAGSRLLPISAQVIIDASGRSSAVSHLLGSRRTIEDRLVCGWMLGRVSFSAASAGFSYIQSTENGWWYSAPVPDGLRVLAFHTDADLPAAHAAQDPKILFLNALADKNLNEILSACEFIPSDAHGFTAAHSALTTPIAGANWLAVGDAAMSFDPLSGQGLLNALYTGLMAANTIKSYFGGGAKNFDAYERNLMGIWKIYRQRLAGYYYSENRWLHSPFWRRRRTGILAALARVSSHSAAGEHAWVYASCFVHLYSLRRP